MNVNSMEIKAGDKFGFLNRRGHEVLTAERVTKTRIIAGHHRFVRETGKRVGTNHYICPLTEAEDGLRHQEYRKKCIDAMRALRDVAERELLRLMRGYGQHRNFDLETVDAIKSLTEKIDRSEII